MLRCRLLPVAAVVAIGLVVAGDALALSPIPLRTVFAEGTVRAMVRANGRLFLGGDFWRLSTKSGPGVPVDPATGNASLITGEIAGAAVYAVRNDGHGGWYVGGSFTRVGGLPRSNLAHIRADGSVDPGFAPAVAGPVRAMAVSGSTIFVGGDFSSVGGQARNDLAAVTATGEVTSFDPQPNGAVVALQIAGQTLFVGGRFTAMAGPGHGYLAAFHLPDGTLVSSFDPAPDGTVRTIATAAGIVYAGGEFTQIGGLRRPRLAALRSADGSAESGFDPEPGGPVDAIAPVGSSLFVGGGFDTFRGGVHSARFARLDAATGAVTRSYGNIFLSASVDALQLIGTRLYGGGSMRSGVFSFVVDTTSGDASAWGPGTDGPIEAIARNSSGNALYVGGDFAGVCPCGPGVLAAVDEATGTPVGGFDPGVFKADGGATATVQALATDGTALYLGGTFASVGGVPRNNLAAVDATDGSLRPEFQVDANRPVQALALASTTLFVGGRFGTLGSRRRKALGAIDTSTGTVTGFTSGVDGQVLALGVAGSTLYVGGVFTRAAGQARSSLASFTLPTGALTPFAHDFQDAVFALNVAGDVLYAAGWFRSVDGEPRDGLAAFDTSTTALTSFHPSPLGYLWAVTSSRTNVYAGGAPDGGPAGMLAELDAATGARSTGSPKLNGRVLALLPGPSGVLYAGGSFTQIGSIHQPGFAAFAP